MKLEIKNLKICDFRSEETLCFEATLYINGQSRIIVSNGGHGGCDDHRPSKKSISYKEMYQDLEDLYAYCKTLPPRQTDFGEVDVCLDILVNELVEKFQITKELKKDLRKRICFVKDDNYYTLEEKPTPQMLKVAQGSESLKDYTILNTLPLDDAYSLYKSAVFS